MKSYSLLHLADRTLLRDLATLVARDRDTTACLLAHLAEVDARKLYLPAGYPSMFLYCVHELHLCEQAAFTRIRAARAAREFPAIFDAVAEGRLHLSAVVMLAPHLRPENADELLAAGTNRTRAEIEQLLAQRFPRPDVPSRILALSGPASVSEQPSPGTGGTGPVRTREQLTPGTAGPSSIPTGERLFPGIVDRSTNQRFQPRSTATASRHVTGRPEGSDRARVAPLAPRRFALQLTMSQELHDKLRYAQELLSHRVPAGDVAAVLERVLDLAIPRLEKRKLAATERPRPSQRSTANGRHVPAHVKRAVWERDGGQCTFVSHAGRRCPARSWLEFDHIEEVARGGRATIAGMRLRCRAHNQFGAERTFGVEFMRHKRDRRHAANGAKGTGAEAAHTGAAAAGTPSPWPAATRTNADEVIPWLRALGFRADEARRAAALCESIPEASLEQRVRAALGHLAPRASCLRRATPP